MTGKDAGSSNAFRSVFASFLLLVAVFAVARLLSGAEPANAQQPARSSAAGANARPQSNPTAARIQQLSVMAVVNGEQVTRQQLADECVRRDADVLESILNKHLIWQECRNRNIVITGEDVEEEVRGMASKFGLTVERWLTMLERERDIAPDKYRRDIVWPTLALRRLASAQIQVSQDEIRQAFEAEYGPKVKARLIVVGSRKKADQLRAQAAADPSKFGDLAKEHSEDSSSAAARGLIPPIRKHIGNPEIEQTAFAMKEGDISPVIQVANQYLILKCEGQVPENYVSSQHVRKIEQQMHDQIRDQKLREAAGQLFQQLQQSAQIENFFAQPDGQQRRPGVAAVINGQQISMKQLADECVLRHGKDVLEGEINRVLLVQALANAQVQVDQKSIDQEIARAADTYGYLRPDGSPDIQAWLKTVTETDNVSVDLYVRDAVWPSVALKKLVEGNVEVTEEDLNKGFVANYGERVEVLTVVVASQRTANQVWEMCNNPTDQFFGELANQYSIEPVSKANFGKIPPIRRHGGQPVIEEEAFRLQPGELSGIISLADKFVILRCLGRTDPVVQDFAAVESELKRDIREKKLRLAMAEEFDRLKETAQIDNFLAGKSQSGKQAKVQRASFDR